MIAETRVVLDAVERTAKLSENIVKDIWSVMDAASEKSSPVRMLGKQGVEAMQGAAKTASSL